jgi:hypothetical protein
VSAVWLLLGLLVLSYVGTILVGGRTIRGFGLPSGVEYLLLGFVLGPHVLGVVTGALVEAFAPLLVVGCAWLSFVAGICYLQVGQRRIHFGRAAFGVLSAALIGGAVAAAVWQALGLLPVLHAIAGMSLSDMFRGAVNHGPLEIDRTHRLLLAGSVGTVSCATTRHAVRWVVERHGAKGPLSDALADYARASVLAPALSLMLLVAAAAGPELQDFAYSVRVTVPLAVGFLLGAVASVLLGREFRRDESWGILLGTSFLGIGVASRLGQSAVATTFFMGLTVAMLSPHRLDLKTMVGPTEKPVMLPLAVLAGASIQPSAPFAPLLIVVGLLARTFFELLRGAAVCAVEPAARPAGPSVGLGLVSTGAFSLAAAVALSLRLPTALGSSVLAYAGAALVFGELLGPLMLRRALTQAGEITPNSAEADDLGEAETEPPRKSELG